MPGRPQAAAPAVLEVVDADEPPLRVFFGAAPLSIAKADYASRIETWEKWQRRRPSSPRAEPAGSA